MVDRPDDVAEEVSSSQGQQTHEVGESSRPPQTEDEIFRTQLVAAVSMFTQVMHNPKFIALLQPPSPSQLVGAQKQKSDLVKAQPQVIHTAESMETLVHLSETMQPPKPVPNVQEQVAETPVFQAVPVQPATFQQPIAGSNGQGTNLQAMQQVFPPPSGHPGYFGGGSVFQSMAGHAPGNQFYMPGTVFGGAVPVLGSVAGESIGYFRSWKPHVDSLGKKLGVKNIQAGVGCGIGVGHGFGIGITLKPGTVQQLKHLMEQAFYSVNERLKSFSGSSGPDEGISNKDRTLTVSEGKTLPDILSPKGLASIQSLGSSVQSNSLAATKGQFTQEPTHGEVIRLQTENTMLLTLLRHQEQIESLAKENAALKQALAEVSLKPKASCDQAEHISQDKQGNSGAKCLECRRREAKTRKGRIPKFGPLISSCDG
ncbi:hypothetical protein L7F22_051959 [Adiantum nelumboides]|nr:hypothetical protein [Adiantum nelumboides]